MNSLLMFQALVPALRLHLEQVLGFSRLRGERLNKIATQIDPVRPELDELVLVHIADLRRLRHSPVLRSDLWGFSEFGEAAIRQLYRALIRNHRPGSEKKYTDQESLNPDPNEFL